MQRANFSYTIFNGMGVGASNPNIVQGLTIYASQKD